MNEVHGLLDAPVYLTKVEHYEYHLPGGNGVRMMPKPITVRPDATDADLQVWLDGFADDQNGSVTEVGWHTYRVDNRLILTTESGSVCTFVFASVAHARYSIEVEAEYLAIRETDPSLA